MTKVLGERVSYPIIASELDVVDVDNLTTHVSYSTKELTALCPVTGQPDQYELFVSYQAVGKTIESKSLKLYLWGFRDRGIYAEDLAATIARDLAKALRVAVTAVVKQQVRGGLVLEAVAEAEPIMGADDV